MKKLLLLFLIGIQFSFYSQESRNFTAQLSVAPSYYFNSMERFHENIQSFNYAISGRVFWNTAHRLSFGIETGNILLYRANNFTLSPESEISTRLIPIHAAIRMRLYGNIYATGTFGPSILTNRIESRFGVQTTSVFSIADFSVSLGYRRYLTDQIFIFAELKYFYSSKLEDQCFQIPLGCGIKF